MLKPSVWESRMEQSQELITPPPLLDDLDETARIKAIQDRLREDTKKRAQAQAKRQRQR